MIRVWSRIMRGCWPLLALCWSGPAQAAISERDVEACRALVEEYRALEVKETSSEDECSLGRLDLGIDLICPEQAEALSTHPWAPLLVRSTGDLKLADLEGLHAFSRAHQAGAPRPVVDTDSLPVVLAQLDRPTKESLSLAERFWQALRDWWKGSDVANVNWLEGISVPEVVLTSLYYGSVALLLLLAIGIVWVEVRAANITRRRTRPSTWRDAGPGATRSLSVDDIRRAPLREQPRLLLRLALDRLMASGVLRVPVSATHREIAGLALTGGGALRQLSEAAERAAFGGWQPREPDMQELEDAFSRLVHETPTPRSREPAA